MRKFRVMLVALAATVVIAAGQVGVAQAVLLQFGQVAEMKRGRRRHSRAPTPLASSALMSPTSHPLQGAGRSRSTGTAK